MTYVASRVELPYKATPLYWRTLGAATLSIVESYCPDPEIVYEKYGSVKRKISSRTVNWSDRRNSIYLLNVSSGLDDHGFRQNYASLTTLGMVDEDNVLPVARYMFDILTQTSSDTHNLVVFKNFIPIKDDVTFIDLRSNGPANNESLSRANEQDGQDLMMGIMSSPYVSLSCL